MTRVFVARHPTEAHLVAEFLGAEGIAAEIRGEALFGVRGDVPPSADTLPTVWVQDADTGDAQRLLAAAKEDRLAQQPHHAWRCLGCGEHVEAQFTVCWNCGTQAPAIAD